MRPNKVLCRDKIQLTSDAAGPELGCMAGRLSCLDLHDVVDDKMVASERVTEMSDSPPHMSTLLARRLVPKSELLPELIVLIPSEV